MDSILHQLADLLLKAIPTFLLVIVLHFYLKAVFFKPLEKVLQQRYDATEGARKRAEESLARAAEKTAQYEAAMRAARAELYQAQEQIHKEMQAREAAQLAEARSQSDTAVKQAKAGLAQEVEAAKAGLERDSEALANQIADAILRGSAA